MDADQKKLLEKVSNTIRALSFEGVQKANSGHPGLPMGCAEFGAYLYGCVLRHNPKNSHFPNRDRFILSAGHGSMFLYSCLHLAGFDLPMEQLKSFRQLHSHTPGHPEYRETDGVETTTGPLGQGVGNAVGQAFGIKILADLFNTKEHQIFDGKVYCLAGDGCLMEGVSGEASSFAGHLKLDNLVLVHDANKITLDGPLDQSGSEDTRKRYESYGFEIYTMDGNDLDDVKKVMDEIATKKQDRPIFLEMTTIIGKGSPNKQGTSGVHGSPLGPEEM
ncbi:MAG: transketolase, partial [Simkaniaceae bacterium]|nr:transketolase [Simkaniaceae bacterium]